MRGQLLLQSEAWMRRAGEIERSQDSVPECSKLGMQNAAALDKVLEIPDASTSLQMR